MAQYQSFPGAAGDSRTLDKLKALRFPEMEGRSFLDVGCNEGFFCGFAKFQGASRAVGIDHSRQFTDRARRRFPDCEFLQQGWDSLPEGPFDVILLASALHYADDQPALLRRLMDQLSPDGVLILELGIVSSRESAWVEVERGIDHRYFPTMPKLREILRGYAWKWMGPSVSQAGDPVARHVIHISNKRPVAYLLLQPPAYGKSTIAASLFAPGHVPVLSGDGLIDQAVNGKIDAPANLVQLLSDQYSPYALDEVVTRVFEKGFAPQLIDLWLSRVESGDFALDAYIPVEHHSTVEQLLADAGYLPVTLRWERVGPRLVGADLLAAKAEAFYLSMQGSSPTDSVTREAEASHKAVGFVDDLTLSASGLVVRGWAVDASGSLPPRLAVVINGRRFIAARIEKQLRPDVQRHMGLPHALVGFRFNVEVPELDSFAQLDDQPKVFAIDEIGEPSGSAYQLAGSLVQLFAGLGGAGGSNESGTDRERK